MVLLPNNQPVYLEGDTVSGVVLAINNPDAADDFQAVGYIDSADAGVTRMLWDVNLDGTVWSATTLTLTDGSPFYGADISDSGLIGGRVIVNNESIAAIAMFTEAGLEASLRFNPNPGEIASIWDVQVDEEGDLVGEGYEPVGPAGHSRAIIWPAGGGVVEPECRNRVRQYTGQRNRPGLRSDAGRGPRRKGRPRRDRLPLCQRSDERSRDDVAGGPALEF